MNDHVLTVEEAARSLSVGRSSLYQLIASGEIASFTIGRRRLITTGALSEFVARRISVARESSVDTSAMSPTPEAR